MSDQPSGGSPAGLTQSDLMDVLIRVGIIGVLVVLCFRIFSPFMGILLWALILAVALFPLHQRMAARVGNREGRAATLLVLLLLIVIGAPLILLGGLFADYIHDTYQAVATDSVTVPPPPPGVAEWPLVGEKLFELWSRAAVDMPGLRAELEPQLGDLSSRLLALATSTMGTVLLLLGSLIIAGIMMAYGRAGSDAMERIISRLAGRENGPRIHTLTTATIRSVATGVIGVAVIQAVLLGVGFAFSGIPMAGVLAVIVLLFGILQLPMLIVSLPAIGFLWWAGDN
ncbi:MAG: AI-2E family transporter, partial [Bacteroidetes bacterium]